MTSTSTINNAGSEAAVRDFKKSEIDWDGSIKDKKVPTYTGEKELDVIEICDNCGKAGNIHQMKGLGDNRYPVCEGCGAGELRHESVENLLSTSFREGHAGDDPEDKYRVEAEIEKMGFDEEKRISVEARIELFKDGEKKLTILETVDSGNLRPDEPDLKDTISQNSSYWMPGDQSASKRVSADWQSDEVSEMSNEDLALQVLEWIEHDWDQVAAFDYEEVQE